MTTVSVPDTVQPPSPWVIEKDRLERLRQAIAKAGELLPLSGPITAFAFLNTLQALEHLPFDEGMRLGARLYGCQPYLSEDRYRAKLARGRIHMEDLSAVLIESLGDRADELIGSLGTRYALRLAMLQFPLQIGPAEELRWFVAEMDALKQFRAEASPAVRERFVEETRHWVMRDLRDGGQEPAQTPDKRTRQALSELARGFGETSVEHWSEPTRKWESLALRALWRVCHDGVSGVPPAEPAADQAVRCRDDLRQATGVDTDTLVNEVLIRFCAAFTDQGFAHWALPERDLGFFKAFCSLYRRPGGPPDRWLHELPRELARLEESGAGPLDSIVESLELLGVGENEWDDVIAASLLSLRGWAGMLHHMEVRGDRVPLAVVPGTLVEFLAIQLVLQRVALAYVAKETLAYRGPLAGLRDVARARTAKQNVTSVEQRAFLVFQLAQVCDWTPPALYRMSRGEWTTLVAEIEAFSGMDRRWVFHQAFERRFRVRTLDALSVHARRPVGRVATPRFQICFCLDAREESFRRHLEEHTPDVETFGAAGFYGVAMYYRGAGDAHFAALCPIVIKPERWVVEDVIYTLEETNRRRAKTRRALGTASHQVHVGSRSIAGGVLLAAGLGVLASVPLVARVLFPRLTARIRRTAGRFVEPPPITRLRLERSTPTAGPAEDQIGYTVDEMANIGERMLRDIGLTSGFARLVIFLGHGSFCLNNPHKSSYDCGACSGTPGGPNGRALAAILNDIRVREILAGRGLRIPNETVFVGGLHNTAVDSVTFLDLDLLPKSHYQDVAAAQRILAEVCERNAHERCRRFDSAPLDLSLEAAHRHVEGRSEDLAQTRPEFGNATNAICIVGRRERTRGLYLDRRSFLASYDPTQDDVEHTILARILAAAVPVCEGINMQYSLSYIDNPGWACGTKLPHNVTSLLGVMDGAASDLRPGLPWQSVEIHEPVRLLFVIETTPQAMLDIMDRNPVIGRILRNGWAQLAVLNPDSEEIQVFTKGEFSVYRAETTQLAKAATSADWYRGWRNHLGFAAIES